MSPWHHIPYERLSPELRRALTILNRRWVIVWLMTCVAVAGAYYLNGRRVDDIQEGRRAGTATTCNVTNAIIAAGRATITGGMVDPELASFLEQHGLAPRKVREAASRAAAERYAKNITDAVIVSIGNGAKALVTDKGLIRCDELAKITKTGK